jgi:hypothetical protein
MIEFGKYNVKELANEGVEFQFEDIASGEYIPTKFVVYGMDSDEINKARKEFSAVTDNKHVTDAKKKMAMRRFLAECVKSWDDSPETGIAFQGNLIKNGDREALIEMLSFCPQFEGQLSDFITDRTNFLSK